MGRLWHIKALRFARQWWRITWSSTIAPLTDSSALLQFLITFALVFFILPPSGFVLWREQLQSLIDGVLAFFLAVPAFALMNGVLAIFKTRSEEDKLGFWQGNKFIYHSKLHAYTVEVSAKDNDRRLLFKVDEPEIDSR